MQLFTVSTGEIIFLTSSVLTFACGLIIVLTNPWRMINRSYFLAAALSAMWLFCAFMAIHIGQSEANYSRRYELLFWLRMTNAAAAFLPWTYFLIKTTIQETEPMMRTLMRSWRWLAYSCALAALAFSEYFIPSDSTSESQKRGMGYPIYLFIQTSVCIWYIHDAVKTLSKSSGVRRLEIKFFVINISLGCLTVLVSFVVSKVLGLPLLRNVGPFVIVASIGLTVWALFHHRVFDARQIVATLGHRISTLIVLAGSIVILSSYLAALIPEPASLLISAGCGGLLAAWWDRKASLWLGLDAQQALIAPRAQIIEWARSESDVENLKVRFEGFLCDWCQTNFATFYTNEPRELPEPFLGQSNLSENFPFLIQSGYTTPELLDRRWPEKGMQQCKELLAAHRLGALIASPRGSAAPSSLVALGRKHSLRPYTHPEIQLLMALIELMDNILIHAKVAEHKARIEKMESAAMMSRGLAHDLNNLATPVSTFLLHMENSVKPGSAEAAVLADAKHSIKVMQDYIRESLFFARRLVPQFERVLSSEILSSAVRLTQDRAQWHGVKVVIKTDEQFLFDADRALVQRLLQNLVFNGIDASKRGGSVELSAGAIDDDYARFTVTDHGMGIPPAAQDHIFEPYFTTKDTGHEVRGLGLGLAICRKIVDLHRGKIEVSTTHGQGTTFAVILPRNQATQLAAVPDQEPAEALSVSCPP
jgi:signal transduction histidine kinase